MLLIKNRRRQQAGFTLLEVLVAVIILAVGLLGVATLQAQGLGFSYSATQRSQATVLAYEIVDRMRASRDWGIANLTALDDYQVDFSETVTPGGDCDDSPCTRQQLAVFDVMRWKQLLQDSRHGLPGGDGEVCVFLSDGSVADFTAFNDPAQDPCGFADSANPSAVLVAVSVRWNDDRFSENGDGMVTFTTRTSL